MNFIFNRNLQRLLYALLLPLIFSANGYAGIMVGGTRFIYQQDNENGIRFLVRNSDDKSYLIQSKILPDNTNGNNQQQVLPGSEESGFVATPPLMPLRNKQENYIHIIRKSGKLPDDRESLFQLSVAAIPSGIPASNDLQVAIRSRYKLIYRPTGLNGSPEQAYQMLRWQKNGASIKIENPTPYYVTLFQLSINGKMQPAEGVVPPFGTRTESWCPKADQCRLQWQSLDDTGAPTEAWVIIPQSMAQTGKAKISLSAGRMNNSATKNSVKSED